MGMVANQMLIEWIDKLRQQRADRRAKTLAILANIFLGIWFILDMTGCTLNGQILVTRAWKDDAVFFLIFLGSFVFFLVKENIGKYILEVWLGLWFITQFLSHWWYTLFGNGEGKIRYFEGTIKLFISDDTYIPDVYHIVLHILIILAFVTVLLFIINTHKTQKR